MRSSPFCKDNPESSGKFIAFFWARCGCLADRSVAEKASIPLFASVGQAAYDMNGDDISGLVWSLGGGIRYFVTNQISFDGYLVYVSTSLQGAAGDNSLTKRALL
jgi:hypothetical protein